MGGSAARALAFGRPLVAAGEAGWFRLFGPESAAGLFRDSFWSDTSAADPVGDLRWILDEVLRDPSKRRDLGKFSREFAEASFGLTAMAEKLAAVYEGALAAYRVDDWIADARLEAMSLQRRFSRRRSTPLTTTSGS